MAEIKQKKIKISEIEMLNGISRLADNVVKKVG